MAECTYSTTWLHEGYRIREACVHERSRINFTTFLHMHPKTKLKWITRAKQAFLQSQHPERGEHHG